MSGKDIFSFIDRDPNFAREIDDNCLFCLKDDGNERQLTSLASRSIAHPIEQRIISLLQKKCEICDGNDLENISNLHSCLWR